MSAMEVSKLTRDMMVQMFKEGKRFDGRGLLDLKDVEVLLEVSNKAEGSARVKLGKTEVIVGVKLSPGEPYPDSPDKGNLTVSGDLLPLASPRFEQGPPGFDAIELPRLVDRAVRESGIIDLSKLVIKEGEKVWTVFIDIYPINDDGALIDAASIGAIIALKNAVIPHMDKNYNTDYAKKSTTPLPISKEIYPLSFTFFKLDKFLILNPTREEEEACEAKITFGISKNKNQYFINSCQKGRELIFTQEEIETMMKILPEKYNELDKKLKKFV